MSNELSECFNALSWSANSFGKHVHDNGRSFVAIGDISCGASFESSRSNETFVDIEISGETGHLANDIDDNGNSFVADS